MSSDKLVQNVVDRFNSMKRERSVWDDHFERLAELFLPRAMGFVSQRQEGERRNDERYDSVPMLAARGLATAIDGLLKPKADRWFSIRGQDEALNEMDVAKQWFRDTEDRMFATIYARRARFQQATGETDQDLVVLGTACLFIGLAADQRSLLFKAMPMANTFVGRNGEGQIDHIIVRQRMSARQAAARFGESNIGARAQEALRGPGAKPDEMFTYIHAVLPRDDRDARRIDFLNMPFAQVWIELESEHRIAEGGFQEFPYAVPVWESAAGETYGRSAAMLALADANTAQAMAKTLLAAAQTVVDPPLAIAQEAVPFARMFPGGQTFYDVEVARQLGRIPIEPINTGGNIPVGREMQNDTRDQIWAAFFRNVLNLPTDGPQMTATEVIERKQEFIRTIGPVFGRLESDYIGVIVDRVYNLMARAGAFAEPPEEIAEAPIEFEYRSPIERARKEIEAASAARAAELLAPYAEADPTVLDNVNRDKLTRDIFEGVGAPPDWLLSPDRVQSLREQRAQAQQAQQQAEQAQQIAEIVKQGSEAGKNIKDVVPDMFRGS